MQVDHLLADGQPDTGRARLRLPLEERLMIEHQFHQAQLDLGQWMRLAATVLAHTARGAAVVAPPRVHRCRFKHIELISTHGATLDTVIV